MVPSPSLSKRENASLNSAICSSVNWSACRDKVWLGRDKKIKKKKGESEKGKGAHHTYLHARKSKYRQFVEMWKLCAGNALITAFVLLLIFFSLKIVRSGAREMNYGDCRSHENQTGVKNKIRRRILCNKRDVRKRRRVLARLFSSQNRHSVD